MKNDILSLPGYRMCEYMLVLQPHEDLYDRIKQVKREFALQYEAPMAEWGKPHIALVRFTQLQMMEERIKNRLNTIAMALPAFKVELKDFGSYPSHTIFINVESKTPLQMVTKHLKTAQALLKTKEQKAHFMDNFFITVARGLAPWQYEKGWLEYSNKHFTAKFIARNMVLLRRPEGEKAYRPIARFEFMNMPIITKQAVLF